MGDDVTTWPFMAAMAAMIVFLVQWCVLSVWRWRHGSVSRLFASEREARGMKLLREWLSPEQLRSFERNDAFEVVGSRTGARYRIHRGTTVNIEQLGETGRPICAWCVVPAGNLVMGDVMPAQKIALESDEPAAMSVAIRYAGVRSRVVP